MNNTTKYLSILALSCLALSACHNDEPKDGDKDKKEENSQNVPQGSVADYDSCHKDADCDTDSYCDRVCLPLGSNGDECSAGRMCESGHCVDGVCCDTACNGANMSCTLEKHAGLCFCKGNFAGDKCDNCKANYFGQDCSQKAACLHGAPNDGLNGDGHCKACFGSWSGIDCDIPSSCPHGTASTGLNGTGKCRSCDDGWVGTNCDEEVPCKNGAFDPLSGLCSCNYGWVGTKCEIKVTCQNGGTVNETDGTCLSGTCPGGVTGINCDKTITCNTANGVLDEVSGTCSSCTGNWVLGPNSNCDVEKACVHGTADNITGKCSGDCDNNYWAGENCDKCITGSIPNASCTFTSGHNDSNCKIKIYCGTNSYYYSYKVAKMADGKWWIVDNLNYYFNADNTYSANSKIYYNFSEAQKVCPVGWHLPTQADYKAMLQATDSTDCSLKSSFWTTKTCTPKLNNAGFNIGTYTDGNTYGYYSDNKLLNRGGGFFAWSDTTSGTTNAYYFNRYYNDDTIGVSLNMSQSYYMLVRCVKDN